MNTALLAIERRLKNVRADAPDEEIVPRLSALSEGAALDWFWQMSRHPQIDRLWLLLQLTYVVIQRPASWDPAAVRREHEAHYGETATVELTHRWCWACDSSEDLYSHHVLEIQNGGSNTWRNKVPLCFPCHQYLHPWLKEEPGAQRRRASSFEVLADIVGRGERKP